MTGIALGTVGAAAGARVLGALPSKRRFDAITFFGAPALLSLVALAAAIPARRARVDLIAALRSGSSSSTPWTAF
jgi:hypothetical protein